MTDTCFLSLLAPLRGKFLLDPRLWTLDRFDIATKKLKIHEKSTRSLQVTRYPLLPRPAGIAERIGGCHSRKFFLKPERDHALNFVFR